ncbi:MAG: hypothetical protein JRI61_09765 [Deltaproteobacteria bacterium]|nr:hypothetical protein [Deltaproteobacteria bacterium]
MMAEMEERRAHARYQIKDGFLVILNPSSAQIGKIVDIGLGGLSFLYKKNEKINAPCEVSIILDAKRTISDGPFRFSANIVSDAKIEDNIPNDSAGRKLCRMRFSELSYHQSFWLQKTIKNSTTGNV